MQVVSGRTAVAALAAAITVCSADASVATVTFMLTGPVNHATASFTSTASYGGDSYTLTFSSFTSGYPQVDSTFGLNIPTFDWTTATVSLTAPAGKNLLFTGYSLTSGFRLGAGSTFDLGTSTGNALPSTGSAWPPTAPGTYYVASGAFVFDDGDSVTFTNNAVWGGVNAGGWMDSMTFEIQAAAIPAPFAAPGAAALLALVGARGRRRR